MRARIIEVLEREQKELIFYENMKIYLSPEYFKLNKNVNRRDLVQVLPDDVVWNQIRPFELDFSKLNRKVSRFSFIDDIEPKELDISDEELDHRIFENNINNRNYRKKMEVLRDGFGNKS